MSYNNRIHVHLCIDLLLCMYTYILIRVYIYIYMAHASDITLHWRKTTWGAFMSEDLQSKDLEEIRQAPEGKHAPVVCYFLADGGI